MFTLSFLIQLLHRTPVPAAMRTTPFRVEVRHG